MLKLRLNFLSQSKCPSIYMGGANAVFISIFLILFFSFCFYFQLFTFTVQAHVGCFFTFSSLHFLFICGGFWLYAWKNCMFHKNYVIHFPHDPCGKSRTPLKKLYALHCMLNEFIVNYPIKNEYRKKKSINHIWNWNQLLFAYSTQIFLGLWIFNIFVQLIWDIAKKYHWTNYDK